MDKFTPLPNNSQAGARDPVLFIHAAALPGDLYEAAESRLSSALAMLDAVSQHKGDLGHDNAPAIADAASLLLSDAKGLFAGFYEATVSERRKAPAEHAVTGPGIATFPGGAGEQHEARRAAYAVALLKLLFRHADATEATLILQRIEAAVTTAQAVRYRPGLNAAAYDLFQRYALNKEGA